MSGPVPLILAGAFRSFMTATTRANAFPRPRGAPPPSLCHATVPQAVLCDSGESWETEYMGCPFLNPGTRPRLFPRRQRRQSHTPSSAMVPHGCPLPPSWSIEPGSGGVVLPQPDVPHPPAGEGAASVPADAVVDSRRQPVSASHSLSEYSCALVVSLLMLWLQRCPCVLTKKGRVPAVVFQRNLDSDVFVA